MMKSAFFSFALFFSIYSVNTKYIFSGASSALSENDLLGEWQLGTSVISSSKSNTYFFHKNKLFEYSTNGQDALIEISKISGRYFVKNDTVFVKPIAITKRIGGHLSKNHETPINDFWEMTGGNFKTIKLVNSEVYPLIVKIGKGKAFITINEAKYFRI